MVLIIDDSPEEKIGNFVNFLDRAGIEHKIASTLKRAEELWKECGNEIDVIILDFIFPNSDTDITEYTDNIPNGVKFLCDHEFLMSNRNIELIVNTSADEDVIQKFLKKTKCFRSNNDILYSFTEKYPLSEAEPVLKNRIIALIKSVVEKRKMLKNAANEPCKWNSMNNRWKGTKEIFGVYGHDGD